MKRMIFRFIGKIPEGKFEVTCMCGHYLNEFKLISAGQEIICPKCGSKFEFVQQSGHWHLFITPSTGVVQ